MSMAYGYIEDIYILNLKCEFRHFSSIYQKGRNEGGRGKKRNKKEGRKGGRVKKKNNKNMFFTENSSFGHVMLLIKYVKK